MRGSNDPLATVITAFAAMSQGKPSKAAMVMHAPELMPCPCGSFVKTKTKTKTKLSQSVAQYATCCGRFIETGDSPPDAIFLMRSRYTAYVLEKVNYLLSTWHPDTRPKELQIDHDIKWLGLEIKSYSVSGANTSEVEFVARYRLAGKGHRLHERSRFECLNQTWYYTSGDFLGD